MRALWVTDPSSSRSLQSWFPALGSLMPKIASWLRYSKRPGSSDWAAGGPQTLTHPRGSRWPKSKHRGAASAELVIIVPIVVLLLSGLAAGWRIHAAHTQVADVAAAAARAASLADNGYQATNWAKETAAADLNTIGLACLNTTVNTDVSGFTVPLGQQAEVIVSVTCELQLGDLGIPIIGGTRWITGTSHEVLDTYRRRSP